jgi:GTP-binding protein
MKPVVALVGRPNVGKSALFNRIVQKRVSIVEETPGVTRDRVYADTEWSGKSFTVVDTGGFEVDAKDLALMVRGQAEQAINEADLIVLVVDARAGVSPPDIDIAQVVRSGSRPVIVAANKAESDRDTKTSTEFYELGLGEPLPVSAVHGLGVGELLDRIVELLPEAPPSGEAPEPVKVAIVGRPNVGKSSLVNALLGHERMIVSELPGTTRDAVDVPWPAGEDTFLLIDTAGLRRKGRIEATLEKYSANRSLKAVDRCDVALILLDATEGLLEQDKKIAGYAHRQGRASVLVLNKWDIAGESPRAKESFKALLRARMGFMEYAPVEFISARTGYRLTGLPALIMRVYGSFCRQVKTADVNKVIQDAMRVSRPPSSAGKQLNIFYGTQVKTKPPTLLFFVNNSELMTDPYERYLEDRVRAAFDFEGTPVRFIWRTRE